MISGSATVSCPIYYIPPAPGQPPVTFTWAKTINFSGPQIEMSITDEYWLNFVQYGICYLSVSAQDSHGNVASVSCPTASCSFEIDPVRFAGHLNLVMLSDFDDDTIPNNFDNCPFAYNKDQRNIDSQDGGDVCDICPTDSTDTCNTEGSASVSIDQTGGVLSNFDGTASVTVPSGALSSPTSVSITSYPQEPGFQVSGGGSGSAYSNAFDFGPSITFSSPGVAITIYYSGYTEGTLGIYKFNTATGFWDPVAGASCTTPDENGAGTCSATLTHFSKYLVGAVMDADGDGVADAVDQCPTVYGQAKYNGCPYGVLITAVNHTVDQRKSSSNPASSKSALVGQTMRLYKKSDLASAGYTSVTWKDYYNIINSNVPYAGYAYAYTGSPQPIPYTKCVTGEAGCYIIGVPSPADYYVISEEVTGCQADVHIGSSISATDSDWSTKGYVQKNLQLLTTIKKDGSSKCDAATSTVVSGSNLEIIQPEYVIWDGSQEAYPFVLSGDGDWIVDITPYVPAGYVVSPFNVIEVVSSETKAVAFTVSEVGSKPSDTTVVMTLTHKGKKKSLSLKVGGKDSNAWAAKKNAKRPLLSALLDLSDGQKEVVLFVMLVAFLVGGYYLGKTGKKK